MERLDDIAAFIGEVASRTEQLKQSAMREMRIMDEARRRFSDASEKHFDSMERLQGMTYWRETEIQKRYKEMAMHELQNLEDARKKFLDASEEHHVSLEKLEPIREKYKEEIRNYSKSLNQNEFICESERDIYRFYCISIIAAYEGDALVPEAMAESEWFKLVRELKLHAKLVTASGERLPVSNVFQQLPAEEEWELED